jgi:hypothetical protein
MTMPLITQPDDLPELIQTWHDAFEVMRYQLENDDDLTDEAIDAAVERIAAPIIDAIDCTECGNCCMSLDVYLKASDAQRLAQGLDVPLDAITTGYVDRESAQPVNEWGKFRHSPCQFLKNKCCTVYEHRPFACREYPVLTPYFRWLLEDTIEGASICPIIFNVLRRMTDEVDRMQQAYASQNPPDDSA